MPEAVPAPPTGLPAAALPSDPPRRTTGTRVRSGNAMSRTRRAVLDAAAHCVERYGVRRTTMGDIALKAAVAKGTLYNHFRTKDDVLTALVQAAVDDLRETCLDAVRQAAGDDGLEAALRAAAAQLAASGPLRRVAADDPGLAARLAAPGDGRTGAAARDAVRAVLGAAGADDGDDAVELVLRWLVSQMLWPAQPHAAGGAARLAAAVARPAGA
ncbi:MAG TPA: TetR/AcrR family transcriptional regulator [Mycobacteriales bacterium]|nr:TetR/AcrR family transcriptional regulator [Mycobacteriales bacterium]